MPLESKSQEELIALIASLQETTEQLRATIDRQHAPIEELQNPTGSERKQRRMIKALNPNQSSEGLGQRVELMLRLAETEAEGLLAKARREAAALVEEAKSDRGLMTGRKIAGAPSLTAPVP